jgi:hypothetical protein
MSDRNPYAPPKAKVTDITGDRPDTPRLNRIGFGQRLAVLVFVCAVVTVAAVVTGAYGWYAGYSTLLEFENAGTIVALVCCGLGVTLWGPSFSHGSRLSEDGYMPTPATGNPRNKYRGLLLLCGGLCFLGFVILAHYAFS